MSCGLTLRYECADADMKQEGGEEIVTPVTEIVTPVDTGSGPDNVDQVRSLKAI